MIPLGQNKILFRFARLLALLQTLHKSHPTIKLRDKSHPTILIPAMRIPSFALSGSLFGGTNFSHVITSAGLSGMKKSFNTCLQRKIIIIKKCKQIYTNTTWKTVPSYRNEIWFTHVIVGWNMSRLDMLKFCSGKPSPCNHNHYLNSYLNNSICSSP